MKLLFDENFPHPLKAELMASGHDVELSAAWRAQAPDNAVLEYARSMGRVLLTLDKGFGKLAVADRQPHCGLVIVDSIPLKLLGIAVLAALQDHSDALAAGALIMIDQQGRVRIRPPG